MPTLILLRSVPFTNFRTFLKVTRYYQTRKHVKSLASTLIIKGNLDARFSFGYVT